MFVECVFFFTNGKEYTFYLTRSLPVKNPAKAGFVMVTC